MNEPSFIIPRSNPKVLRVAIISEDGSFTVETGVSDRILIVAVSSSYIVLNSFIPPRHSLIPESIPFTNVSIGTS